MTTDFDTLDLPGESFDAIYAFETVGYSEDLDAWMARCMRMLKPGGRLLIRSPGGLDRCRREKDYRNVSAFFDNWGYNFLGANVLVYKLRRLGFEPIRYRQVPFLAWGFTWNYLGLMLLWKYRLKMQHLHRSREDHLAHVEGVRVQQPLQSRARLQAASCGDQRRGRKGAASRGGRVRQVSGPRRDGGALAPAKASCRKGPRSAGFDAAGRDLLDLARAIATPVRRVATPVRTRNSSSAGVRIRSTAVGVRNALDTKDRVSKADCSNSRNGSSPIFVLSATMAAFSLSIAALRSTSVGIKEFAPQDGEGWVPRRHLHVEAASDPWHRRRYPRRHMPMFGRLSCIKPDRPAQKLRHSIPASISAAEDFSQALCSGIAANVARPAAETASGQAASARPVSAGVSRGSRSRPDGVGGFPP